MAKTLIIVGVIAATIAGLGVMQLIGGLDPMHSRHMGAGWECDATRASAVICVKDVKSPPRPK